MGGSTDDGGIRAPSADIHLYFTVQLSEYWDMYDFYFISLTTAFLPHDSHHRLSRFTHVNGLAFMTHDFMASAFTERAGLYLRHTTYELALMYNY